MPPDEISGFEIWGGGYQESVFLDRLDHTSSDILSGLRYAKDQLNRLLHLRPEAYYGISVMDRGSYYPRASTGHTDPHDGRFKHQRFGEAHHSELTADVGCDVGRWSKQTTTRRIYVNGPS